MTGSSYQAELFESPPPRSEWDRLDTGQRRLVESFIEGFNALGQGLAVERLSFPRDKQAVLAVRLDQSAEIGREHVCTPVTNAHLVWRLQLAKPNTNTTVHPYIHLRT